MIFSVFINVIWAQEVCSEACIVDITQRLTALEAKNDDLTGNVENLQAENDQLKIDNRELKNDVQELEGRVESYTAIFGQNMG